MPILQPYKRKYYDEAQDESFSGEDMLPFVSITYTEGAEAPASSMALNPKNTEEKIVTEKVKIYFWQNIVKKAFKF